MTVGGLLENGFRMKAVCGQCSVTLKVDIITIVKLNGPEYSLVNQRAPCRVYDCNGWVTFMYSSGKGDPFKPLVLR